MAASVSKRKRDVEEPVLDEPTPARKQAKTAAARVDNEDMREAPRIWEFSTDDEVDFC